MRVRRKGASFGVTLLHLIIFGLLALRTYENFNFTGQTSIRYHGVCLINKANQTTQSTLVWKASDPLLKVDSSFTLTCP